MERLRKYPDKILEQILHCVFSEQMKRREQRREKEKDDILILTKHHALYIIDMLSK